MKTCETQIDSIISQRVHELNKRVDRLFSFLFLVEWLLGVILAAYNTPTSWDGNEIIIHPHIWTALGLGGLVAGYATYVTTKHRGEESNRYIVAISQMVFSSLYIHFTGGRIESHFHIFGSLAFIAFYRDWRPLALATAITAADHFLAVFLWSENVYGVANVSLWRAVEHAAWVIFEDFFLLIAIRDGNKEIRLTSKHQFELHVAQEQLQVMINERTNQLQKAHSTVIDQQKILVSTSKMCTLGEMAGGIAHEINNPLNIITLSCENLSTLLEQETLNKEKIKDVSRSIQRTTERIAKIVKGLKTLSRQSDKDDFVLAPLSQIINETLALCNERLRRQSIRFQSNEVDPEIKIICNPTAISQVILNLIGNACDAIEKQDDKWISLDCHVKDNEVHISVTDSGHGIPQAVVDKIMLPFFTTKELGKGTGLGLSISKGIIERHNGLLQYDSNCNNTRFLIKLPMKIAS